VASLPKQFAVFASLGQFAVASVVDFLSSGGEFILGGDIANGAVQADVVVVFDVIGDDASGVVEGEWHQGPDAIALERFVPAFDFAVGLRIVGRGAGVGHAGDADELFEILGDELRSVVGDDAWCGVGELFVGALQDGSHVGILHFFADFPMNDEAAEAVEDGAKEVEGAGDIEVADIDVPLVVRLKGLSEAGSFLGDGGG